MALFRFGEGVGDGEVGRSHPSNMLDSRLCVTELNRSCPFVGGGGDGGSAGLAWPDIFAVPSPSSSSSSCKAFSVPSEGTIDNDTRREFALRYHSSGTQNLKKRLAAGEPKGLGQKGETTTLNKLDVPGSLVDSRTC